MGILDTAKEAVQLVQKIDNVELYKTILDLQSDALKVMEDNAELREQNKALEEAFKIKDTLVFENNAYFTVHEEKKAGPYCTYCWDKERQLVCLHKDEKNWWWCLIHQKQKRHIRSA